MTDHANDVTIHGYPPIGSPRSAHEGERCQICGAAYSTVYWLPDDVWAAITPRLDQPGAGLLCPSCADQRARDAGLTLRWSASVMVSVAHRIEQYVETGQ